MDAQMEKAMKMYKATGRVLEILSKIPPEKRRNVIELVKLRLALRGPQSATRLKISLTGTL